MVNQTVSNASKGWLIVPALWLTGLALAADAPAPKALEDLQLDEVLVEGQRPETSTRKLTAWFDRLVGQFSYEGYVERRNSTGVAMERAEVQGGSQCVRFGQAVAVQCLVNATWPEMRGPNGVQVPGGVSSLTPAVAVYALDGPKKYVGYLQVDNDGLAATGKGWIVGDTLISRAPCADFPGKCERVVRIEAPLDGKVVRMSVDLERDGKLELRYSFQWKRLPPGQVAEVSTSAVASQPATRRAGAVVPPDIEAWLRRMVGQYRVVVPRPCQELKDAGLEDEVPCPELKTEVAEATKRGPLEAQCQNIGAGYGVRCVAYMKWPETSAPPAKRAESMNSNPVYSLYGYDPVQRGIALVGVVPTSSVGPAGFAVGHLKEDRLTYKPDCAYPPCKALEQLFIPPGGEWIRLRSSSNVGRSGIFRLAAKWYRMREAPIAEPVKPPRVLTDPSPRPR